MATHVTYPGVYVREEASGAQAIASAATSTALFVGMSDKGPMDVPTRVQSQAEFERAFGTSSSGELVDQVRQFYINGGGEAWIMRIANGARAAAITLRNEGDNADSLRLVARDKGNAGNMLRAEVDYDTGSPERSFNLTLYRHELRPDGGYDKREVETFTNLSMDSSATRYAPNVVNGASMLATVEDPAPAAANAGVSIGGAIYVGSAAAAAAAFSALITNTAKAFRASVANRPPVDVVLAAGAAPAAVGAGIGAAYAAQGVTVNATSVLVVFGGGRVLEIASTTGPVVITPAASADVSVALMLGAGAGGVEMDSSTPRRPAPTGITSWIGPMTAAIGAGNWMAGIGALATELRSAIVSLTLTDPDDPDAPPGGWVTPAGTIVTGTPGDSIAAETATLGSFANIRRALDEIATAIGGLSTARWKARRAGLRIVVTPNYGGPEAGLNSAVKSTTYAADAAGNIFRISAPGKGASNVAGYSLGRQGGLTPQGKQANVAPADEGFDGNEPVLTDYSNAFNTIRSELDAFNFLVLPRASGQTDVERKGLWGAASALAAERRAILFVDPAEDWPTIKSAEDGVAALKVGVETRNSVIYWPRLRIPAVGLTEGKLVDPSGSIAGLMARTDDRYGVWAAPAGIEATIRGIVGIQKNMSDDENGVLNPKALNAIRLFPSGAVAWGARTMIGSDDTGNIDDKYIPVRRTMLFIEESLYRGLKFAVFRPNGEDLWAAIRLAAGSFMNTLMHQGAFASRNKTEAYYVLCDSTTTTETDRNLGIVNVIVAFAPLKPAEFVILTVKQIAAQATI
ncbi:MAG TPA: phage tail sheath C-terminal domain-containing protein [Allosphingosinicella sp.]